MKLKLKTLSQLKKENLVFLIHDNHVELLKCTLLKLDILGNEIEVKQSLNNLNFYHYIDEDGISFILNYDLFVNIPNLSEG